MRDFGTAILRWRTALAPKCVRNMFDLAQRYRSSRGDDIGYPIGNPFNPGNPPQNPFQE